MLDKTLFYSYFPEYKGRDDAIAHRAFQIFEKGHESAAEKGDLPGVPPGDVDNVLNYLNEARKRMTGNSRLRGFPKTKSNERIIKARFKEGFTVNDFQSVIDHKCTEWRNTEFQRYIQPSTLFKASKFPEYLAASEVVQGRTVSAVDKEIDEMMG